MTPDCVKSPDDVPCNGYQVIRAHLEVEREVQKKLIIERDKWYNMAMRYKSALTDARNALHNDFEPDNQSLAYKRADAALSL